MTKEELKKITLLDIFQECNDKETAQALSTNGTNSAALAKILLQESNTEPKVKGEDITNLPEVEAITADVIALSDKPKKFVRGKYTTVGFPVLYGGNQYLVKLKSSPKEGQNVTIKVYASMLPDNQDESKKVLRVWTGQ